MTKVGTLTFLSSFPEQEVLALPLRDYQVVPKFRHDLYIVAHAGENPRHQTQASLPKGGSTLSRDDQVLLPCSQRASLAQKALQAPLSLEGANHPESSHLKTRVRYYRRSPHQVLLHT